MTRLTAPIQRETTATVFDRGKHRPVIVSLLPNNTIGLRLKGSQRVFYLTVDGCYDLAVKRDVESNRRVKRKPR